ncbi:hypothetical protein JHK87_027393 [Glycine soja]|nr:hypothetical protein JHK87_027393 [Glycine soja]
MGHLLPQAVDSFAKGDQMKAEKLLEQWESQGVTHLQYARVNLVDLAGSKRQKNSGAEGERLKVCDFLQAKITIAFVGIGEKNAGLVLRAEQRGGGEADIVVARRLEFLASAQSSEDSSTFPFDIESAVRSSNNTVSDTFSMCNGLFLSIVPFFWWLSCTLLMFLVVSVLWVGPGSILHGPLENATTDDVTPKLYCDKEEFPYELLHPLEDCNVNSSLSFTLQICRVEDILVEGLIKGSIVHFHRARTISVESSRTISASRIGCTGGLGHGNTLSNGIGSGGGHGGTGGEAFYNDNHVEGGYSYGNATLPCELGSGSGNGNSTRTTAGGGIIVVGSLEHPLSSLSIQGYVKADGGNFEPQIRNEKFAIFDNFTGGPGGGFGGTILMFLHMLTIGKSVVLSSIGGYSSSNGSGGGGGGRIHFHWSDIPTGDVYLPIASNFIILSDYDKGGKGKGQGGSGANGTITRKAFPKGLYGPSHTCYQDSIDLRVS